MDRFIEPGQTLTGAKSSDLKSSMDRFIGSCSDYDFKKADI